MSHLKLIITFSSLTLLVALFTSCDDNESPALSDVPHIELAKVEFVEVGDYWDLDSLILSIHFTDGDANLGLSYNAIDSPFHAYNYFLADNSGKTQKIATFLRDPEISPHVGPKVNGRKGKLMTVRTRNEPGFESLPVFEGFCFPYRRTSILVAEEDKHVIDPGYDITDTLYSESLSAFYVVDDTFYVELNPNHLNIEVDFLVANEAGVFAEFDGDGICDWSVDGRFPEIDKLSPENDLVSGPFRISGPNDMSGTIRFAMTSIGLLQWFEDKTLKLRVKIRDRDLNVSKTIETPPFTLEDIRR